MKLKSLLRTFGCVAALSGTAYSAELVANGNFEEGGEIIGGDPFRWNATVAPERTGQIAPPTLQPNLSGFVAYMDVGTQIAQTFSIGLQADTLYNIKFDGYLGAADLVGTDSITAQIGYGIRDQQGESFYAGAIRSSDVQSGSPTFNNQPLDGTAREYTFSFTTPSEINGTPEGSTDGVKQNLLIFIQPALSNVLFAERFYLDNVSVTTTAVPEPSTWALLGLSLGAMLLGSRRMRRKAA